MAHRIDNRGWFSKLCCGCCDVEESAERSPINQDPHRSDSYTGVTFAPEVVHDERLKREEVERQERIEQQRQQEAAQHGTYVPPQTQDCLVTPPHTPPPYSGGFSSVTPEKGTHAITPDKVKKKKVEKNVIDY